MSVLLLRLRGALQSWGDSSRFSRRETRSEPTKSGVLGLLAAAEGRRRSDPIEDLAGLTFGVRIDQRGQLVRDFQTARSLDGRRTMPLSYRYYLADAVFLAGVEGPPELIAGLAQAVQSPAFPLYLGRRSCPPTQPVYVGIVEEKLVPALRDAEWQAARWYRRRQSMSTRLEIVVDAEATTEEGIADTIRDLPESYSPVRRQYGWRDVVRLPGVPMDNPLGREEPDYLAALGGA